jgi:hypothetical protein
MFISCGTVALMVLVQFSNICGAQISENWPRTTRAMVAQLMIHVYML